MTPLLDDPRTAQLEMLNEVARIATLDLELQPMLQRITDALASRLGWELVALVTIDTARDAFRCEAVTASVETSVHIGYGRSLGSGIVGLVAATGEPELIDDVSTREDYIETAPGVRSELCVPVKHHGKLVAVLNVESKQLAAFYGQLPVLTFVADQIAGAIASAQRYEELQQRVRLMEMMSEVSRTALEGSDVSELLQRVESYIADHFPLRSVSIERCSDIPPSSSETGLVVPIRFHDSIVGALKLEADSAEVFSGANAVAFHAFANQIAGAIRLAEMAAQLEEKTRALEAANSHLEVISTHDGLTGLANRRHFDETLQLEWRRAARNGSALSILLMDIDRFKNFNDAHGHQAGDEVLRSVSRALLTCVHRAADLVARYGGEELVVLLPDTGAHQALAIAAQVREKISADCGVTVSVGVATAIVTRDDSAAGELVRRADAALYQAKKGGRNRVVAHPGE